MFAKCPSRNVASCLHTLACKGLNLHQWQRVRCLVQKLSWLLADEDCYFSTFQAFRLVDRFLITVTDIIHIGRIKNHRTLSLVNRDTIDKVYLTILSIYSATFSKCFIKYLHPNQVALASAV